MDFILLFLEFFKIGLFTFGGGYAMIPIVHEVVDLGWISENQFSNMVGISEITPGPIALNMATYVGVLKNGFFGGLCATLGVVLPSFIIICIIAAILTKFAENKFVKSALRGAMFVAIGLLISIVFTMLLQVTTDFNGNNIFNLSINIDTIKILLFVIVGYSLMWITRQKKPTAIPVIFMSLVIGVAVNYGVVATFITFVFLELIFLITKPRKKSK